MSGWKSHCFGHHLMVGFFGTEVSDELRAFVRRYKVGNFILFRRNVTDKEQLYHLCAQLDALAMEETGLPAIIATDQEGGAVSRLPDDCAAVPTAMAVAATGDPAFAYQAGRITGKELLAAGVNFDLAPSLDVNCNPRNPVINVRSYGDTPERVSAFGCAMIRGLQESGAMACAKHFPGHGDTDVDSHVGLPSVDKSIDELEACELAPFRAAIQSGVQAVMTTHILFPQIDDSGVPATMSRRILTGLLREKLGFHGLIVTDCMMMDAIMRYYGTVEGSAAAVKAGADMVCICHDLELAGRACDEIERAAREGLIDADQLSASAARIEASKRMLAKIKRPPLSVAGCAAHREAIAEMRDAAVCHVGAPVPVLGERPLFVSCAQFKLSQASDAVDESESFAHWLKDELGGTALSVSREPSEEEIKKACGLAERASAVVLGTVNAHLIGRQVKLMHALADTGVPMAVAALRNGYDLADLPPGVCGFALYEYMKESAHSLARVLRGEIAPKGTPATRIDA